MNTHAAIFKSLLLAGLVWFAGCSSRAITDASQHSVAGPWLLEINSSDVGYAQVPVTIEVLGNSFEAHSSEGVAGRMFGWWEYTLAKIFTDYFQRGALLHLNNGVIDRTNDGFELRADLVSAIGPMKFSGRVTGDRLSGTLTRRSQIVGVVSGQRNIPPLPLRDYPSIARRALDSTARYLYDPSLLKGSSWREYEAELKQAATASGDDLEMLFAAYRLADLLPFSHYTLYSPARETFQDSTIARVETERRIRLEEISPSVGLLRIASFDGDSKEIDSVFSLILNKGYANLILDLRGNLGGNISAMRVGSYLVDSARFGGVFVTRRWFETHDAPPAITQFADFPIVSEANFDLLVDGLHRSEGIALKLLPAERRYTGRLFVLTDRRTASSCEPLVYGIKQYRLGTIIGEPTAGAMLSSEQFSVGDGWQVVIPTAEYYAADGFRIDQVGVQPDVEVKSKDALERALAETGAK